jgi:pilus assembly protein Flp/PilA
MRSTTCSSTGRLCSAALAWWKDEEGVTAIEYALVAALIFLAALSSITGFADALKVLFDNVQAAITTALNP